MSILRTYRKQSSPQQLPRYQLKSILMSSRQLHAICFKQIFQSRHCPLSEQFVAVQIRAMCWENSRWPKLLSTASLFCMRLVPSKRFVGQQLTTAEGSLSFGFTPVSSENATTFVDVTLDLLEELVVYSFAEREHFCRILQILAGVK